MTNPTFRFHRFDQNDLTTPQTWVPRIDTTDVLERLIADELRAGRLTPARRRRVVGYAANLGLSAVQAGRLIACIRDEALANGDPKLRRHALRLTPPVEGRIPAYRRIILVLTVAILLDAILLRLIY